MRVGTMELKADRSFVVIRRRRRRRVVRFSERGREQSI
jgi:hypothetical protein